MKCYKESNKLVIIFRNNRNINLESEPASMDRVNALLWGDKVGLQSRGVLTAIINLL